MIQNLLRALTIMTISIFYLLESTFCNLLDFVNVKCALDLGLGDQGVGVLTMGDREWRADLLFFVCNFTRSG